MIRKVVPIALAVLAATLAAPAGARTTAHPDTEVFATVHDGTLEVGNDLITRRWSLAKFRTLSLTDRRSGQIVAGEGPDAWLDLVAGGGTTALSLDTFDAGVPLISRLPDGGLTVAVPVGPVDRLIEIHPGVAGMTLSLRATAPLAVAGYALDEVHPLHPGTAVAQAFRAGSDWREPGWSPQVAVGDAQTGDWRLSTPITGDGTVTGQWLSTVGPQGGVFQVLERVDLPSSVVGRKAGASWVGADLSRDVLPVGPVEGDAHVSNPGAPVGRQRVLTPGTVLEKAFTGVAADADDEGWQYVNALHSSRPSGSWVRGIVWNSDSTDSNRISTGAKDDMNLAEVKRQAAIAKQLGVDVFVLDDGWQARSGDWCPDSPECPEPRTTWGPRFPDASFTAVRAAIAPMRLGLWMSPMSFHPSSQAFTSNPQWTCLPIGAGTVALNEAQDGSSSNEAGIGFWNPRAVGAGGRNIDYLESRIRRAIEQWQVSYFKFDFLAWFDCAGAEPVDIYSYREEFLAMVDRIQAAHPGVTIQIDETNDYRLWPFESVSRGATWFQNGAPLPPQLLHNLWSLAPYVPSDALGQSSFGSGRNAYSTDYLAAVMLLSHPTLKLDLTQFTAAEVPTIRRWTDAYRRNVDLFRGVTYPLLADPLSARWTGLQVWDRARQRGVVMAFRQDDTSDGAVLRLHAVDGTRYVLRDLLTGDLIATVSGSELTSGYAVSAPAIRRAVAFTVEPLAD